VKLPDSSFGRGVAP